MSKKKKNWIDHVVDAVNDDVVATNNTKTIKQFNKFKFNTRKIHKLKIAFIQMYLHMYICTIVSKPPTANDE